MIRSSLQRLARALGYVIISRNNPRAGILEQPGSTLFDYVLHHCYPRPHGLNFIQIGANDGRLLDPLARYRGPGGWSGLMFEPKAGNFAALERNHDSAATLRRAAVDVTPGRRMIYDLDRARLPALPDWAAGLGSFDRERVAAAARSLGLAETAVVAEEVETVSWEQVWREFGDRRCDVLVTDTEGYDVTLLRAAGLAAHRPRLVHFEHACVAPEERLAFYRELIGLGYELLTEGPDTTAWLPS